MRLSNANLDRLPSHISRPRYDRAGVTPGIVHLGIGAFHRAHQAVVIDDLLSKGATDWGIVGASLRNSDTRDALAPQDHLYTVAIRGGADEEHRIVGSILDIVAAKGAPERLIAWMADPSTRIVSLTVTEKGYCHTPQTGDLDAGHPDIVHDLQNPDSPRSAVGFIAAALSRRRGSGVAPFTILCCDNLSANGHTVRRILTQFAALRSRELSNWIADEVAFPSTMVDRIVPETTGADRAVVSAALGMTDAWPVVTEPFTQWIIEDRFPEGRPDFADAGVQLVSDVTPYEHMKLRLLNGAHSALAYLGYLAGHETIADAVADHDLRQYLLSLWRDEIIPVVPPPSGVDLNGYAGELLTRFANPSIRHRTWQIAMDGSQKLPQRLLSTIRERLARGLPINRLALAVAAWIRYVGGLDEAGGTIDVRDPLSALLQKTLISAGEHPAHRIAAILGIDAVFGPDLPGSAAFTAALTDAYTLLLTKGARASAAIAATS